MTHSRKDIFHGKSIQTENRDRPIFKIVTATILSGLCVLLALHDANAACKAHATLRNPTSAYKIKGPIATDTRSGLQWQRCTVGMDWKDSRCVGEPKGMSLEEATDYAGRHGKGWRLPTAEELDGIMEAACSSPSLNPAIFPDIHITDDEDAELSWSYWSTTHDSLMKDMVYVFDFSNGFADIHSTGYALNVRLVRSTR